MAKITNVAKLYNICERKKVVHFQYILHQITLARDITITSILKKRFALVGAKRFLVRLIGSDFDPGGFFTRLLRALRRGGTSCRPP